ncbi:MAG: nitrous oxide reductase accessory protein NosL [Flavobacteriales bacterium]|nr:nitrous oxide reductase accessory protein NosL [Flavobacteriales bacterium]
MMIIMDKHFGALLVNSKGKMIKFDSDECLLRFLTDDSKFKPVEFYTVNYSKPGNLINAEESFFLFGGSIKSPMGGKLLSVSTDQEANELLSKFKAEKLDWNEFKKISNE